MKKLKFALVFMILLMFIPSASAFSLFGIDFTKFWDGVKSIGAEEEKVVEKEVVPPKKTTTSKPKSTATKSTTPPKPKPEVSVNLDGTVYTQSTLKSVINTKDNLKGYVQGFNYECVFIETTQGDKFTIHFNVETGEMTKLETKENCDRKIELDETLISDFKNDGFKVGNIKTYLSKVDLPTSTYFKALKVFTVG